MKPESQHMNQSLLFSIQKDLGDGVPSSFSAASFGPQPRVGMWVHGSLWFQRKTCRAPGNRAPRLQEALSEEQLKCASSSPLSSAQKVTVGWQALPPHPVTEFSSSYLTPALMVALSWICEVALYPHHSPGWVLSSLHFCSPRWREPNATVSLADPSWPQESAAFHEGSTVSSSGGRNFSSASKTKTT